jgi:RNA polymerase sigma-70 factor (ECF subfamily)
MAADPQQIPEPRGEAGPTGAGASCPDAVLRAVLALFDSHYDDVFRFARRSVDDSTAEDVTQEVFTRLMRLGDLDRRDIRPAYLFKIASNLMKRRFQRERRLGEIVRRSVGRHAGGAGVERAEDAVAGRADRATASRALQRLSARERDAVDLIVCRGLSYREAAESMGAKVSDVNNWRYRGVERLRRDGTGGV